MLPGDRHRPADRSRSGHDTACPPPPTSPGRPCAAAALRDKKNHGGDACDLIVPGADRPLPHRAHPGGGASGTGCADGRGSMNVTIQPGPAHGHGCRIPASKSQAHRLLICAALGEGETELLCGGLSARHPGHDRLPQGPGGRTSGRQAGSASGSQPTPDGARRSCAACLRGERLHPALPAAPWPGRWGRRPSSAAGGRLPQRPLGPLDEAAPSPTAWGFRRGGRAALYCHGQPAAPGTIPCRANVSSQYISGPAAWPCRCLTGDSTPRPSPATLESAGYVRHDGGRPGRVAASARQRTGQIWSIPGGQRFRLPRAAAGWRGTGPTPPSSCAPGRVSWRGHHRGGPVPPLLPGGPGGARTCCARFGAEVTESEGGRAPSGTGCSRGVTIDAASHPGPDPRPQRGGGRRRGGHPHRKRPPPARSRSPTGWRAPPP